MPISTPSSRPERSVLAALKTGQKVPLLRPVSCRRDVSIGGDEVEYVLAAEYNDSDSVTLSCVDPEFKDTLLHRLDTLRRGRDLCDVVLLVAGREIFAHRCVLAAMSPAFYDQFIVPTGGRLNNMAANATANGHHGQEQTPPRVEQDHGGVDHLDATTPAANGESERPRRHSGDTLYVEFPDCDFDCFESLVNYGYTSRLSIVASKVPKLYKLAAALKVHSCARIAADYLVQNLRPFNCIGVRKSANKHNDSLLAAQVDAYIQANIQTIAQASNEFSSLPCIQVRVIGVPSDNAVRSADDLRVLADKVVHWCKQQELTDGRELVLTDKTHLLYLDSDLSLQDCVDMDDRSSIGSCDMVQDYKKDQARANPLLQFRRKSQSTANGLSERQSTGDTLEGGAATTESGASAGMRSNLSGNLYSMLSRDSINSIASGPSGAGSDEIAWKVIAIAKLSDSNFITLAVVRKLLTVISVQLMPANSISHNNHLLQGQVSPVASQPPSDPTHTAAPTQAAVDSPTCTAAATNSLGSDCGTVQSKRQNMIHRCLQDGLGRLPLAQMQRSRCSVGAVVLDDVLYVMGGYDRGECMSSVECFSLARNAWWPAADMTTERGRLGAAVVQARGTVYAVGGSNGHADLSSVECLQPGTSDCPKWQQLSPLNVPRSHNSCAELDGKIYCVAGYNGQVVCRDCEVYDPGMGTWSPIAPLNMARYQSGCCAWQGRILAAGGCDQWNCTAAVECYDPRQNAWASLPPLSTPRRGCALVVFRVWGEWCSWVSPSTANAAAAPHDDNADNSDVFVAS